LEDKDFNRLNAKLGKILRNALPANLIWTNSMQVRSRTSRYYVVIKAAEKIAARNPRVAARGDALIRRYEQKLREHRNFIRSEGTNPPEVAGWRWRN